MLQKTITNGTNLAQGGGKGYPKINENIETNSKVKSENEKNVSGEMWSDFLKKRRAQRLGVYCGIINKCDTNGI